MSNFRFALAAASGFFFVSDRHSLKEKQSHLEKLIYTCHGRASCSYRVHTTTK